MSFLFFFVLPLDLSSRFDSVDLEQPTMLICLFLIVLLFDPARCLDEKVSCCDEASSYVYSLAGETPQSIHPSGNITWVTSQNFPVLKRLSLRRLLLAVHGVREPHWHLNANELSYCLVRARRVCEKSISFLFRLE